MTGRGWRALHAPGIILFCVLAWESAPVQGGRALGALPATFTGDLPCADCSGIRHHLEMFDASGKFLARFEARHM